MGDVIKMTAKLYDCRDTAKRFFKDEYLNKIKPYQELIKADMLIEELNEQLRLYNVVGRSEQLLCPKCKSEKIIESFPHHNRYTCFDCKTEWAK